MGMMRVARAWGAYPVNWSKVELYAFEFRNWNGLKGQGGVEEAHQPRE